MYQRAGARRARGSGEHLEPERAGGRSAVRAARAAVRVTAAGRFPTVTAAPSATARRGRRCAASRRLYDVPLDVTYQADVWGSIRRSVAANAAVAQASAADLENARLAVPIGARRRLLPGAGTRRRPRLLEPTVKSYEQYLQLTQDRFQGGVVSMADVALAQTQLERRPRSVDRCRHRAGAVRARDRGAHRPCPIGTVDTACDDRACAADRASGVAFIAAGTTARHRRGGASSGGRQPTDRSRQGRVLSRHQSWWQCRFSGGSHRRPAHVADAILVGRCAGCRNALRRWQAARAGQGDAKPRTTPPWRTTGRQC